MDAPASSTSTAPDPALIAAIKETIKAELAPVVQEQLDHLACSRPMDLIDRCRPNQRYLLTESGQRSEA